MVSSYADGLSLLLSGLTGLLIVASAIYAVGYLRVQEEPASRTRWLWPLLATVWVGLTFVWWSDHLLVAYLALDMTGLCAVVLMRLPGTDEARKASSRYLIYTLLASASFLLGLALLYAAHGSLRLDELAELESPSRLALGALGAMLAGLLLKAAVFPLHGWMPPAHASAWAPVSAIHAALVLKASFFLAVRLWDSLSPQAISAAQLLGAIGVLGILWGSVMAWRQQELKRVVAYSTVAQMGYLMLLFPLTAGTDQEVVQLARESVWLLVFNHALAKGAMFLAAGNLVLSMGRGDIQGLSGVSSRLPLSLLVFGLAGVCIMGMPPSGGFVAKWLLLHAAMISGQWHWVGALALGTLLSAAYLFRVFRHCFVDDHETQASFRSPPLALDLIALMLAVMAVSMGLMAEWPLSLLRTEAMS